MCPFALCAVTSARYECNRLPETASFTAGATPTPPVLFMLEKIALVFWLRKNNQVGIVRGRYVGRAHNAALPCPAKLFCNSHLVGFGVACTAVQLPSCEDDILGSHCVKPSLMHIPSSQIDARKRRSCSEGKKGSTVALSSLTCAQ